MHVGHLDLEVFGHGFLNALDADLPTVEVQNVAQSLFCQLERQLAPTEAGESEHFLERTLEFPHIGANVLGDEEGDLLGHHDRFGFRFL